MEKLSLLAQTKSAGHEYTELKSEIKTLFDQIYYSWCTESKADLKALNKLKTAFERISLVEKTYIDTLNLLHHLYHINND